VWESLRRLLFIDLPLYARILWAAYRQIRRHDINVVCMGELVSGGWLGVALKRLLGCRLLFYIHGEEVTTDTAGRLGGDRRQHYLAVADRVISVSSFTSAALEREMGVPPEKIALIPNGVDTARFSPAPLNPALLARWQITDHPLVLTVGRLVPRKGMDMAIHAMLRVVDKHPRARHLIVGDGPYRAELSQLIQQLGLQEHVHLVGALPFNEVLDLFLSCQVFLMPNRTMPDGDTEGFGLVFREANACGKPAVGGRAGGAVDAIDDGQTGYLVDGTNPDDIAQKVILLLDDPALAARMGQQGLTTARYNDVKAVAGRFLDVCESLL
jgi:phosphatidyl-myo-inositol dimannoside synthase